MIATFQFGSDGFMSGPWLNAIWVLLVACGMVSRIPTFSAKKVHLPPALMLPALLGVGLLAVAISSTPWLTIFAGGVLYILTIPIAWFVQRRERERALMMPMAMPSLPVVDTIEERGAREHH